MEGFNELYKNKYAYICGFVYNIIKADPHDIAQEAFCKLSATEYVKNEAMAIDFLKKTAKNICLDFLKRKKVEQNYLKNFSEEEFEKQVELSEIHADILDFIYCKIKELPPVIQKCFLMHCRGIEVKKISKELNISKQTVHNNLQTARNKIRIEILFNKKDALQFFTKRPTL